MIDGIINVYKEQGFTSFDVVAKLRGILKQKKIGHTGTLDPMAEGVLMVCLGKATKLVDMLTAGDKEYRTVMKLGLNTDTEDITGEVLQTFDIPADISDNQVIQVVESFIGTYNQIPPMYSAIKKDGKKLYEYAREGITIERTPREVTIFSIENIEVDLPYISFDVHCSKGTYIRSLCRDIGEKLATGGTMTALTRSNVKGFTIDKALKLGRIEELVKSNELDSHILPVDALISSYKKFTIKEQYSKYLFNGNKLFFNQLSAEEAYEKLADEEIIRIYNGVEFLALYQYSAKEKILKPFKMFLG